MRKHRNKIIILVIALTLLDAIVWWRIFAARGGRGELRIEFLDVGQGDSELVTFPAPGGGPWAGSAQMLVDGGPPNGQVLNALDRVLPATDRSIDLVVLSHPQTDHFGGLIEVMKRYRVGAFLWNGERGELKAFADLERVVREKNIPMIALAAGDRIRYGASRVDVLSPTPEFLRAKDVNDTALVLSLVSNGARVLFTGDMGKMVEEMVAPLLGKIDILKVAHHGSKFSSTQDFLNAVTPTIAVIGVGKNSYGHPTPAVLSRLASVGARIFRTDRDGTVEIVADGSGIRVFSGL